MVQHALPARVGRAAVALVALWAMAGLGLLIPLAHFFLVPGFLFAGVVVFIVRFRNDRSLDGLEGPCPRCKGPGRFGTVGRFREGARVHCEGCGSQLAVRSA